jgi:hypothetical protein
METERDPLDEVDIKIYIDELSGLEDMANVDVEVVERDGRRWFATFFTIEGLVALFEKNAVTGECARGTYLWAEDMIVIRAMSRAAIERTIADLRTTGEFHRAFGLLSPE